MDGPVYAGMERPVFDQAVQERLIHGRGVFWICITGFLGKGIGIQPVRKQ